jgi:hypothetical protein
MSGRRMNGLDNQCMMMDLTHLIACIWGRNCTSVQLLGWHPHFVSFTHQFCKNETLICETRI